MISTSSDGATNNIANCLFDAPSSSDPTSISELQQLADYAIYLEDSREEEQRSLTRNLHNLIGQSLTSIGLGVEAARLTSDAEKLSELLADLKEAVRVAADDVRRVMRQLRPAALDDLGVAAAIQGLVREACRSDVDCRFECRLAPGQRFDKEIETAAFRVVQESLSNAVRDARATEARVCVWGEGDCLRLSIADNGRGLVVDPPVGTRTKCSRLQGIRRRVELLKGSVEFAARGGGGINVRVALPYTVEIA